MSTGPSRHPSDRTLADYRRGTLDAMFRDAARSLVASSHDAYGGFGDGAAWIGRTEAPGSSTSRGGT